MFLYFRHRRFCNVCADQDLNILYLKPDKYPVEKPATWTIKMRSEAGYLTGELMHQLTLEVHDSMILRIRKDCCG